MALHSQDAGALARAHTCLALLVLIGLFLAGCTPTTMVVVRHADKASSPPDDPVLTSAGAQRAQALQDHLADASIDAIIVSDYQRTQLTAQPLADHLGLTPVVVALKPPSNANQYVTNVVQEINDNWIGRDVLIVSHNTLLQQIAQQLGSAPIGMIDEATGYDNLFVLVKPRGSSATRLIRARYGAANPN